MPEEYKKNIIVIDDEYIVRTILEDMIESMGYKVFGFSDSVAAIDFYEKNWKEIGLVLIDMVMPGLNGRETFFLLKKINRNVKAIILSGYTSNEDIKVVVEEGCLGFLKKPVKLKVLEKTINKVLAKSCCVLPNYNNNKKIESIKKTLDIKESDMSEALMNIGGNTELFLKMLSKFIENYSDSGSMILEYSREKKFDDIMMLSHSIKSAAATLGLKKLENIAYVLEKTSIEKDSEKFEEAFLKFNDEVSHIINKITQCSFILNSSAENESSMETGEKETVLKLLKELKKAVERRRPVLISNILNTKLKGCRCKGFDLESRDLLQKLASKYSYTKMNIFIEKILKEVENG